MSLTTAYIFETLTSRHLAAAINIQVAVELAVELPLYITTAIPWARIFTHLNVDSKKKSINPTLTRILCGLQRTNSTTLFKLSTYFSMRYTVYYPSNLASCIEPCPNDRSREEFILVRITCSFVQIRGVLKSVALSK